MTDVDAADAVRRLAHLGFREPAFHDKVDRAIDRGIEALRLLNTRYHTTMESMLQTRLEHLRAKKNKYRIGHVFQHKKFSYRGVIYGYDAQCERDAQWQAQMNVSNPNQPFYYVLPDASDSIRLFGGPRLTKYVAEENIGEVDEKDAGKGITHQALVNYFTGFSKRGGGGGSYKPNKRLEFEYAQDNEDEEQWSSDFVTL